MYNIIVPVQYNTPSIIILIISSCLSDAHPKINPCVHPKNREIDDTQLL